MERLGGRTYLGAQDLVNALVIRNAVTIRAVLVAGHYPDPFDNGILWGVEQAVSMAYGLSVPEARTFIKIMTAEV